MNQAQAVITVTLATLGNRHKADVPVKSILTADDKKRIIDGVVELFKDGVVGFSVKESNAQRVADPRELRNYVVGLCNNHWRKHKALNGGVKFVPSYTRETIIPTTTATEQKAA